MEIMKKILMPILFVVFALVGCQREVMLKVNTAPSRIVVQANLSSEGQTVQVMLNRTVSLYGKTSKADISNATVFFKDMVSGRSLFLTGQNGLYTTSESFDVVANAPYMLVVELEDTVLQSQCFMPQQVLADSLAIDKYVNKTTLRDTSYVVTVRFTDIPNQQNYYKIQTHIDGVLLPDINIVNDNFRDGQQIKVSVKDDKLVRDARVRLELQHITPEIYDYYFTMRQAMSGMSDSPANPPTNIFGGAIGYFSAYGVHVMEFRVN